MRSGVKVISKISTIKKSNNFLLCDIFSVEKRLETGANKLSDKHINKGLASPEDKNLGIYLTINLCH